MGLFPCSSPIFHLLFVTFNIVIEFPGVFLYTVAMNDLQPKNILIYRADDNRIRLEVKLEEKTIWLSQKQIGELYQKGKATISEHIKNIFQDGELGPEATVRKFRTVQKEGDRQVERLTEHYNLDLIMAVGYRVRSHVALPWPAPGKAQA